MSDDGAAALPALDAAEAARRTPVWTALAELYLDSELDPPWLRSIARTLAASGYTLPQLEAILDDEVAPVFYGNLLAVAGQWGMWDEADVRALVLAHLRRWRGRRGRRVRAPGWWRRWRVSLVRDDWVAVRLLVREAREGRGARGWG